MSLRDDITSPDDETRAEAFEALMLHGLGLRGDETRPRELGSIYAKISERLASESADGPTNSSHLTRRIAGSDPRARAVWGLIFAARTFQVAHRLLEQYRPPSQTFVELGAGVGPFGLRASLLPSTEEVVLVDLEPQDAGLTIRMFEAIGARAPTLRTADMRRYRPGAGASVAVPYAFREVGGDAGLVRKWLREMDEDGLLFLVEPGTRPIARALQAVRDELHRSVDIVGPCKGATVCPRLLRASDWCHFTLPIRIGPLGQRIADSARRRWAEAHVSLLVMRNRRAAPEGGDTGAEQLVVIEVRGNRHETGVHLCGPRGEERITAMQRDREAFGHLQSLVPGDVVEVDWQAVTFHAQAGRIATMEAVRRIDRADAVV